MRNPLLHLPQASPQTAAKRGKPLPFCAHGRLAFVRTAEGMNTKARIGAGFHLWHSPCSRENIGDCKHRLAANEQA